MEGCKEPKKSYRLHEEFQRAVGTGEPRVSDTLHPGAVTPVMLKAGEF